MKAKAIVVNTLYAIAIMQGRGPDFEIHFHPRRGVYLLG